MGGLPGGVFKCERFVQSEARKPLNWTPIVVTSLSDDADTPGALSDGLSRSSSTSNDSEQPQPVMAVTSLDRPVYDVHAPRDLGTLSKLADPAILDWEEVFQDLQEEEEDLFRPQLPACAELVCF
eukprot:CAMPEP_0175887818 /NCGR_PEP_ID=MMETSP0107_2-20121207/46386_1 /TAXON_ID=195067 ORGANISM="Goniomonas pacifica, Strain CCMP1869" /NCGR_SAMPLE_ID=MMETSP0107_2 /ASSEMBLY_ACC=CAM_ASM_000203 /LENGTH=124 /DNA_ID=CAMNT_0017208319 /DNA_START=220 /DNA_END=594 /DNA_ORIENTATION=-